MLLEQKLASLEKTLDIEYRKLAEFRNRIAHTSSLPEKFDLEERIRRDSLPAIRRYETESWELLAQVALTFTVEEAEAQNSIVQVVQEAEVITNNSYANYPEEVMRLLHQILDTLNKPGQVASAKVKVAVPLVPGIVSYEGELDTEESLKRVFQPFKRLLKRALQKKN